MRFLFYFFMLPILASCTFLPEEWIGLSSSFKDMHSPAHSYSILPPPSASVFAGTQTVYQNNYVLNETMSAKVGETMLRVQAFKKENQLTRELYIDRPITIRIGVDEITLPAKKYSVFGMFDLDDEKFFVLPKVGHYYFLVDSKGKIQERFLYDIENSDKVTIFPDKAEISPSSARMKRATLHEQEKLPFLDFDIVYDGIKNDNIILFYKNAVPGTNGESGSFETLAYPKDVTLISVKGMLVRIIRADQEQITYMVVK